MKDHKYLSNHLFLSLRDISGYDKTNWISIE